jgi:hypothetical protein
MIHVDPSAIPATIARTPPNAARRRTSGRARPGPDAASRIAAGAATSALIWIGIARPIRYASRSRSRALSRSPARSPTTTMRTASSIETA